MGVRSWRIVAMLSEKAPQGESFDEYIMDKPPVRTLRPKVDPPWKAHDEKANKSGQRATIMWVGKAIVGEDGQPTGMRTKGACYHGEWDRNKRTAMACRSFRMERSTKA